MAFEKIQSLNFNMYFTEILKMKTLKHIVGKSII